MSGTRQEDQATHPVTRGRVVANGLDFAYLQAGEGPLALLWHGFPDSPHSFRYIMPALAAAGYRAVAPYSRGYAPTQLPAARSSTHVSQLVADQIAVARALGGGTDAVLIAHDWGAVASWGALRDAPDLWGRAVIMNTPPNDIVGENLRTLTQIKRSFYFWYFQMRRLIVQQIQRDDFAMLRDIWSDWSPGFDNGEDVRAVSDTLHDPAHLRTALSYYWGQFEPTWFGTPEWSNEVHAAVGGVHTQPTLYLHGTTDGCHMVDPSQMERILSYGGPGSKAEFIEGAGHFLVVEKPDIVNARILRWLGE